jgi:hypothetical protein
VRPSARPRKRLETELGEPQLATLARIKTIDDQLR